MTVDLTRDQLLVLADTYEEHLAAGQSREDAAAAFVTKLWELRREQAREERRLNFPRSAQVASGARQ